MISYCTVTDVESKRSSDNRRSAATLMICTMLGTTPGKPAAMPCRMESWTSEIAKLAASSTARVSNPLMMVCVVGAGERAVAGAGVGASVGAGAGDAGGSEVCDDMVVFVKPSVAPGACAEVVACVGAGVGTLVGAEVSDGVGSGVSEVRGGMVVFVALSVAHGAAVGAEVLDGVGAGAGTGLDPGLGSGVSAVVGAVVAAGVGAGGGNAVGPELCVKVAVGVIVVVGTTTVKEGAEGVPVVVGWSNITMPPLPVKPEACNTLVCSAMVVATVCKAGHVLSADTTVELE
mmetsp:Transcript_4598/g.13417  ORF Transcript_4598/g.13417 Transcript_4598/m.13417 type:complete len:289 (+) Transcript_4598:684-1550(+)